MGIGTAGVKKRREELKTAVGKTRAIFDCAKCKDFEPFETSIADGRKRMLAHQEAVHPEVLKGKRTRG